MCAIGRFRFVAYRAVMPRLLLAWLVGLKQNFRAWSSRLATRLSFRGSRSEQRRTRGVAHQHEYAAPCRLSRLKTKRR